MSINQLTILHLKQNQTKTTQSKMFTKLFFIATLAIACANAKPGLLGAAVGPITYSAPLLASPAVAYTAGYANVGDSAVVTSHNSQVINPAYAAYTAPSPFAYAAAPLSYAAAPALAAPLAAQYAAPLAYSTPLAARYVL
ncbi:cuticle protein 16.5-like [Toxorhynchites rutilus septentrionalis]|uniref:cuticle protein 16.5-like n=1 Tax=Toxorhynchites rutilus septentrionalis TaxID=329112 RepID=UPI0024783569|nr:cuticle protein 16.5-like [Toxorhynchites rutilus septentrionalis]